MSAAEVGVDRLPPADIDAEQACLGAMILDPAQIDETALTPADFYRPAHETIATVMFDMHRLGLVIDPITLLNELTDRKLAERVGNAPYVHTLTSAVPTTAHGPHYAAIVRDKALRRRMQQAGVRIGQLAYSDADDTDELLALAYDAVARLDDAALGTHDPLLAESLIAPAFDEIERLAAGGARGIPTPWLDLNALLNPLSAGQYIVVGARPAVGKSTFMLDIARESAFRLKVPTLLCSLEMDKGEIVNRMLSAEGTIPLSTLIRGNLEETDWTKLIKAVDKIGANPLYVDDGGALTLGTLRAKMRRMQSRTGLGLVLIDYLQLMTTPAKAESRQVALADISRGIKLLAKEFRCPIIAASQLNRGLESRSDKRPQLSDLRESGAIENDADVVLLLHRDDLFDRDTPRVGEMDVIISKQRNGPTGTVPVAFQGHYSRTADLANDYTPRPWVNR